MPSGFGSRRPAQIALAAIGSRRRGRGRGRGGLPVVFVSRAGSKRSTIAGVSVDSAGAPLAACIIELYRAGDNSFVDRTVSDGVGAYTFNLEMNSGLFYVVAFNAAGTLTGATLPILVAV